MLQQEVPCWRDAEGHTRRHTPPTQLALGPHSTSTAHSRVQKPLVASWKKLHSSEVSSQSRLIWHGCPSFVISTLGSMHFPEAHAPLQQSVALRERRSAGGAAALELLSARRGAERIRLATSAAARAARARKKSGDRSRWARHTSPGHKRGSRSRRGPRVSNLHRAADRGR